MAGSYLGNLGTLGLGVDRFMANQPANLYDPNAFINPLMLPYLQPQMMRQMANFQNPQLMLPQNSGNFLASALGRMLGGGYSPQAQSSQGQQGQDPTQQLQQQVMAARNKGLQSGMGPGQAMASAVQSLMGNPQYQDAASQAILDRFQQQAIKDGYDPKIAQQQSYNYMNFQRADTGKRITLSAQEYQDMSPEERGKLVRAENLPQVATGRFQQRLENGQYVTYETMPDGSQVKIATSTSPQQFIKNDTTSRNLNLTSSDDPTLLSNTTTGSAADRMRSQLAETQVHVQNATSLAGTISGLLSQGAAGGSAGDLFEKMDNWISTAGQLADKAGDTKFFDQYIKNGKNGMNDYMNGGLLSRLKMGGVQAQTLNTGLNAFAYEYWRSFNPNGRMTPKELTEARDEVLGDNADPNAIMGSINMAVHTMNTNLRHYQQTFGQGNFGPKNPDGDNVQLPPGWTSN